MFPTLWKEFVDCAFQFHHDCGPVHRERSINAWMRALVLEIHWALHKLDLKTIERQRYIKAVTSRLVKHMCLTSQSCCWKSFKTSYKHTLLNLVGSLPRKREGGIAPKDGLTSPKGLIMGCHSGSCLCEG